MYVTFLCTQSISWSSWDKNLNNVLIENTSCHPGNTSSHESRQILRFRDSGLKVFLSFIFTYVYMCTSVWVHATHTRVPEEARRASWDFPITSQPVWVLGTKLWSSATAARAVLPPTEPYISPALGFKLKKFSPVDYQFIETIRLNNSCAEECLTFACTWSFLSAFKHNSPGSPFVLMLLIYSGLVGDESATSPQTASTCYSQHAASDWTDNWVTNGRAEGFSKAHCKRDGFSQRVSLQPPGVPVVGLRGIALLLSLGVIVFLRSSLK